MKPRKKQGFTLIELMVVVTLCALIAHVTITYFYTFDSCIVRSELMYLRMFCQKIRYDAISTGQEQIVTIDPLVHSYYSPYYKHVFPPAVRFGVMDNALGPPSSPQQPINSLCTFNNNKIHFYADGTISSGIIYIVDRNKKVGYALSNGVGAVSYLRLYRYDKKKWICL